MYSNALLEQLRDSAIRETTGNPSYSIPPYSSAVEQIRSLRGTDEEVGCGCDRWSGV